MKIKLEKTIKKSAFYIEKTKQLINLPDLKGKTPLHYAANKNMIEIVDYLAIRNSALVITRDYKS